MLSVIVPTYNERENIGPLVTRLKSALSGEYEVIIVDDNSPDGTADEAERLSKKFPMLRLVRRGGKKGLSTAVVEGVRAAKGEFIVVMDADLSHPPELVPQLSSALESYDIVVASRLMEGGGVKAWPFHRKMLSKGAELLARLLLGVKITDPLSGFFAARKAVFQKTKVRAKGYKILLNIVADNPGMKVKEIPYVFGERHAGETKLGFFEVFTFLADVVRIKLG